MVGLGGKTKKMKSVYVTVTYQYVPNTVKLRYSLNVRVISRFHIQSIDSRRISINVVTSAFVLIVAYVHTYKIMYIGILRVRINGYVRMYNCSLLLIEHSLANRREKP